MLTASQISALRDRSEQLLDPIIEFLIQDIAERVKEAGQLTGTASYNAWRLQQLGVSQRQLKKEIAKRLKISQKQAEQLLTQSAEAGYNFDMSRFPTSHAIPLAANPSVQQVLAATVKQAKEDLANITQTIGFVGNDGVCRDLTDAYIQACDFAFQKVSLGAQDFTSAIREATANLAKKGIRYIDYESGVHTSLEAAVRRNIMGGLGIMQNQISQQNHDYLGCDGWEISAHHGSAPDHEPYQGKQYPDKEFQRLNGSLVRPIGELNCGHFASPIIMGVNDPQYTPEELEAMRQENEEGVTFEGKHYTLYEASQRQRKFERSIRDQKRKILVDESLDDKDKLQQDQIRLQVLKQNYARFSKGVGLPMQHSRLEKAGFDWKKGKAAEKTAKQAKTAEALHEAEKAKEPVKKIDKVKDSTGGKTISRSKEGKTESNRKDFVVWDESRGIKSWTEDRKKRLISAEYASVREPVENGILYDANGKRIFHQKGNSGSVEFTPTQIKQMRGGVLTHNHPGADYGCFSPADIEMLRDSHLTEIRVATPVGVFSMQRPQRWSSEINDLEKIRKVYYDIDKTIGSDYWNRAIRGEMSLLDANNLGQRAVVEDMCKRYRIPFRFDSWDDLGKESYESIL